MKAIKRVSVSESIVEEIQTQIQKGNCKAGDRLPPERELLEQFGVSRSSLREALKQLEIVGLLEIKHGKGTFVSHDGPVRGMMKFLYSRLLLSKAKVLEFMYVRKIIERESITLLAKKHLWSASPEHIEELGKIIQNMKLSLDNPDRFIEEDIKFHTRIAKMSGNSVFPEILNSIRGLFMEQQTAVVRLPGAAQRAYRYHKKIYNAIKCNDYKSTARIMKQHLNDTEKAIISGC